MRDDWYDDRSDESGFWKDEPTSRLERITQRLPQVTGRTPRVRDDWDFRADDAAPTTPLARPRAARPLIGERIEVRRPAGPVRPAGSRSHGTTQQVPVVQPMADAQAEYYFDDERLHRQPAAPAAEPASYEYASMSDEFDDDYGYSEPAFAFAEPGFDRTGGQRRPATAVAVATRAPRAGRSGGLGAFLEQVDPTLRRLGAVAVAVALMVPVAMALRPSDDGAAVAPGATVATAAPVAGANSSLPAGDAAVAGANGATEQQVIINPEDLPPAIPVNPDPTEPTTATTVAAAEDEGGDATTVSQPGRTEEEAKLAAQCTKTYTVVAGDYWILIAKKASVTVDELLAANKATASTAIFPGGTVCLPANASTPTTAPPTTATPTTAKPTPTTAPPTTQAPVTTTPNTAPKTNWTRAEVEAIIRATWPDDLENEAVRIATRESNLTPTAKNFCCYGLFQIYFEVHKGWLSQMGVTSAQQLLDPRVNAYVAVALYNRAGGWGPWKL